VGDRRTSVAINRAASNGGFVIGPPLGALLAALSFDALFVVEGIMVLLVRVTISRMLPPDTQAHGAATTGGSMWRSVLANRPIHSLLPAIVLVDIVCRQLYTTLPVYLRGHGQPSACTPR
jgi:MFS family permease